VTPNAVGASFVARRNRFVVEARLDDGTVVAAHLPNSGRLTHLLEPGRPLVLRRDGHPGRTTSYTATRGWDGCWVGLEASRAPRLLADWLLAGNDVPVLGTVIAVDHEVALAPHRIDLCATTASGSRWWIEVKSAGRTRNGTALLSRTPSSRAGAQLAALAGMVARGRRAAVAFVVQRPDARSLHLAADADPGWIEAVRAARQGGVAILAFGCDVSPTEIAIARELPIVEAAGVHPS
jgi:sugar fermentation stimulation protein A